MSTIDCTHFTDQSEIDTLTVCEYSVITEHVITKTRTHDVQCIANETVVMYG